MLLPVDSIEAAVNVGGITKKARHQCSNNINGRKLHGGMSCRHGRAAAG